MRIEAFVFSWRGYEASASCLEKKIAGHAKVVVVNSEERLRFDHPGWVHLGKEAYFAAQWNKAMELFRGDLLFHIQADASFDEFDKLFARAEEVFEKYDLGVYEPNVDFTDIVYDRSKLVSLESNLALVPMTDCTCWFIAADILRGLPPVDLDVNTYGWGIPALVAALSRIEGKACARDYAFTVRHPKGRGYSSRKAVRQREAYLSSLSPEIARETAEIYSASRKLRSRRRRWR